MEREMKSTRKILIDKTLKINKKLKIQDDWSKGNNIRAKQLKNMLRKILHDKHGKIFFMVNSPSWNLAKHFQENSATNSKIR